VTWDLVCVSALFPARPLDRVCLDLYVCGAREALHLPTFREAPLKLDVIGDETLKLDA
jgi:hypothetical protein